MKYTVQATDTYHRHIQGSHTGHRVKVTQGFLWLLTRNKFLNNILSGSYFNICKSFSPGRGTHQPQKSGNKSNNKVLEQK